MSGGARLGRVPGPPLFRPAYNVGPVGAHQRAYPKNTDIARGHTAECPNIETHFPWVCDCHARAAATPMWLRELRRDRREFIV